MFVFREVTLPNPVGGVAGIGERLHQRDPVIWHGKPVVIALGVHGVLAIHHAAASRHAYRGGRVCGGKRRSFVADPVERRGLDKRIAERSDRIEALLVGEDVQDIRFV